MCIRDRYNIDVTKLEEALSDKTKAVMIAHTLGNPFDLEAVKAFCDRHNLWLVEDNCDALGSVYEIDGSKKLTGTIGDIGTSSFYPPHHMTMGEGGAVSVSYTHLDVYKRQVLQSTAAEAIECYCNLCQKNIEKEAAKDGLFVRPRYSPGYGDLSLDVQSSFLKALNAQKTIGLFLSEGGVMQPEKSVTALMGLSLSLIHIYTVKKLIVSIIIK